MTPETVVTLLLILGFFAWALIAGWVSALLLMAGFLIGVFLSNRLVRP